MLAPAGGKCCPLTHCITAPAAAAVPIYRRNRHQSSSAHFMLELLDEPRKEKREKMKRGERNGGVCIYIYIEERGNG